MDRTDRAPSQGPAPGPEDLVAHAEAVARLLEEIAERLDSMRDEMWILRAGLGQEVGR